MSENSDVVGVETQLKKPPSLAEAGDFGSGLWTLAILSVGVVVVAAVVRCVAGTLVSTCSRLRCGGTDFRIERDIVGLVLVLLGLSNDSAASVGVTRSRPRSRVLRFATSAAGESSCCDGDPAV